MKKTNQYLMGGKLFSTYGTVFELTQGSLRIMLGTHQERSIDYMSR